MSATHTRGVSTASIPTHVAGAADLAPLFACSTVELTNLPAQYLDQCGAYIEAAEDGAREALHLLASDSLDASVSGAMSADSCRARFSAILHLTAELEHLADARALVDQATGLRKEGQA